VIEALLTLYKSDALRRRLASFGVIRFAPVADVAYEALAAVPKR
jgi:hypothetical protein